MEFRKGDLVDYVDQDAVNVEEGLYLIFWPDGEMLRLYAANNLDAGLKIDLKMYQKADLLSSLEYELQSNGIYFFEKIVTDILNEGLRFSFDVKDLDEEKHYQKELKIKPRSFFKNKKYNQIVKAECHAYLIFSDFADERIDHADIDFEESIVKHIPKRRTRTMSSFSELTGSESEVDLHIEKICDDHSKMSNGEILNYQLNHLHKAVNDSIRYGKQKLTVIHGLGKGILKDQVHDLLQEYDEIGSFINEYHPKFGFGATFVFFK